MFPKPISIESSLEVEVNEEGDVTTSSEYTDSDSYSLQDLKEFGWLNDDLLRQSITSDSFYKKVVLPSIGDMPMDEWGFDGSSTEQASGDASDCILRSLVAMMHCAGAGCLVFLLCDSRLDQRIPLWEPPGHWTRPRCGAATALRSGINNSLNVLSSSCCGMRANVH